MSKKRMNGVDAFGSLRARRFAPVYPLTGILVTRSAYQYRVPTKINKTHAKSARPVFAIASSSTRIF
ncbi:MAG: hypothetical protein ACPG32_03405 [Akkermansiaceae bacterium]